MQEIVFIMVSILMCSVIGGALGWSLAKPYYYTNNPEDLELLNI